MNLTHIRMTYFLCFVQLVGGPVYVLKMVADVTKPKLELSRSHVDFGTVLCGQYKIITIRLNNPFSVK